MATEQQRAQWLDERRKSLQASEWAAVLGEDPRRGPLTIYDAKVNGRDNYDNAWMRYGRDVEGAIANMYEDKTGRKVEDLGATKIQYHPDYPWLGATLDRLTYNSFGLPGPLECKSKGLFDKPKDWYIEPPFQDEIQLQAQIACTESRWGVLAALFPGYQFAHKDYEHDEDFFKLALPKLKAFWLCVINRTPPKPTAADLGTAKRLWSREMGDCIALDTERDLVLANEWTDNKASIKTHEKRNKAIEVYFRSEIKENTAGALRDGSKMTLKTTKVKERTQTVGAYEFRTLRRSGGPK